jgi:hypothetical protein
MSKPILIIGKSGSGKSRSIINLDPKETFIVNVNNKDLPIRGWQKKYTQVNEKGEGNMIANDDHEKIDNAMHWIDKKRTDIKVIVIDDFQYIMANEFMRRGKEKGYEKFTEIGMHAWNLLFNARLFRSDLFIVFLAHSEESDSGQTKCKTIGKMLDDKICIEGMFTIVLGTVYEDGKYFFETQTNGQNTLKSPEGLFPSNRIENDLNFVIQSIRKYETE